MLDLQPVAYAITATKDGDAASSNWAGKTSLLEAVDFALTGRRPRDAVRKVDWITRGEPNGEVELALSDGSNVKRSMSTTGSEKLWYYPPNDAKNAAYQESAQGMIDQLLGLSAADAPTWSFRQGEMAQLLRMDPGERLRMFSGWLGLEKLDDCAAMAAGARGEVEKRRAEKQRELDAAELAGTELWRRIAGPSLETVGPEISRLRQQVAEFEAAVAAHASRAADVREREGLVRDAARYDEIVAEGTAAAERLRGMPTNEQLATEFERLQNVVHEHGTARAEVEGEWRALSAVVAGKFDGRCPLAGEACPSAGFVTDTAVRNGARRADVATRMRDAQERERVVVMMLQTVSDEKSRRLHAESRISTLRAAAKPLVERKRRWTELQGAALPSPADDPYPALQAARRRLAELEGAVGQAASLKARGEALRGELGGLEKVAAIPTAAAAVFESARKRIAEGVLAEIEAHANDVLGRIGADLSVAFRWGREGAGLADACGKCGAAFPASRKVKDCARCGAERSARMIERLDLLPSKRSGAADDLASIATAFGTSRWLREDRGSEWGTVLLDEPTGQMDHANMRAFASKLPDVIRSGGFGQAMVVSHHRSALDTMPARIEICSKNGFSVAKVVT